MNNKILTGLVVALTAAVIYLFVTKSSGGDSKDDATGDKSEKLVDEKAIEEIPTVDLSGDGKVVIAYVDGDMIMQKYLFLIDGNAQLQAEQARVNNKLQGMVQSAAKREAEIQKEIQLMTNAKKEEAMRELDKLQRNYQAAEQREMAMLQDQERKLNEMLYLNIRQVLDDYCAKNNIDYVYNYQKGGPFLYVNKANDITVYVLTTLNEKYQKEKGIK